MAEDNPHTDRKIDDRLKTELNRQSDGGLIVESRLAGWHADGRADLAVWLDAPVEERAQSPGERAETTIELREREKSDASRYQEYYGSDIADLSIYDLVVDTGTLSEEGMFQTVKAAVSDIQNGEGNRVSVVYTRFGRRIMN